MRTIYEEEHELFRRSVRRWAEENVYPHTQAWREEGCIGRAAWKSAGEHLKGELSAEMAAEAELYTSEVEGRVVNEYLHLHGGSGYMDEYEISRLFADTRISRIYAGTSEIMREIIGRGLGLDERQRN
jgi:alkylation response protein AidB-like acyl-CoA dehydrogenase